TMQSAPLFTVAKLKPTAAGFALRSFPYAFEILYSNFRVCFRLFVNHPSGGFRKNDFYFQKIQTFAAQRHNRAGRGISFALEKRD
ncbi:MAG: hypothetical protein ACRENG_15830, partial [bacterium]